jgi:hypothetical protein
MVGRDVRIASSLKGAVPCGFFMSICMYLTLILTKVQVPRSETFGLAAFVTSRTKVRNSLLAENGR